MEENQNNEQPEVITETAKTPSTDKKGFNIASMILGIAAILGTCYWFINFPCAILAIVFRVIGRNSEGKGMGIAGMVLAIIAMVLYVIIIVLAIIGIAAFAGSGALNELSSYTY